MCVTLDRLAKNVFTVTSVSGATARVQTAKCCISTPMQQFTQFTHYCQPYTTRGWDLKSPVSRRYGLRKGLCWSSQILVTVLTNQPTTRNSTLLEKLLVPHPVKTFPVFMEPEDSLPACNFPCPRTGKPSSNPPYLTSWRSILISSSIYA